MLHGRDYPSMNPPPTPPRREQGVRPQRFSSPPGRGQGGFMVPMSAPKRLRLSVNPNLSSRFRLCRQHRLLSAQSCSCGRASARSRLWLGYLPHWRSRIP